MTFFEEDSFLVTSTTIVSDMYKWDFKVQTVSGNRRAPVYVIIQYGLFITKYPRFKKKLWIRKICLVFAKFDISALSRTALIQFVSLQ